MRTRSVRIEFFDFERASEKSQPTRQVLRRAWSLGRGTILLLAMSLAASAAWAQGEASISGVAADATGAAIPRATVRIINAEKGSVRTTLTDDAGRYEAPLLAVGAYEVSAEKAGFTTARRTVTLVLGQHANIDLTLIVAGIHQTVQVEGAIEPAVSTSDVSGLVSERQVKDLPLNGRSYDQLLTLNPGVVNYTSQRAGGTGTSNSVVDGYVCGFRPPSAGESLPVEWRRIYQRLGS